MSDIPTDEEREAALEKALAETPNTFERFVRAVKAEGAPLTWNRSKNQSRATVKYQGLSVAAYAVGDVCKILLATTDSEGSLKCFVIDSATAHGIIRAIGSDKKGDVHGNA